MLAAAIAVVFVALAALSAVWVFRPSGQERTSFWSLLFADVATIGFVRAAVVMLAIYAIGSMAALLVSARWIRSVGKGGLDVDPTPADERIEALEDQVRNAQTERDQVVRLLEVLLRG